MKENKIIGVDIDGVLASFEHGYAPLLEKVSGIKFDLSKRDEWAKEWNWEIAAGVTKKQRSAVWEELKADPTFWLRLPAHQGTREFLEKLTPSGLDIYFITNRVGQHVKRQTEDWLRMHGFYISPTVLICKGNVKGDICAALGIDFYIDDKNENCRDVRDLSPETQGFMLARPWNKEVDGVPRLESLDDFMKIIKGERNG